MYLLFVDFGLGLWSWTINNLKEVKYAPGPYLKGTLLQEHVWYMLPEYGPGPYVCYMLPEYGSGPYGSGPTVKAKISKKLKNSKSWSEF